MQGFFRSKLEFVVINVFQFKNMKRVERESYSGKLLANVVFNDMHSSLLLQGNNNRTWNNTTPI